MTSKPTKRNPERKLGYFGKELMNSLILSNPEFKDLEKKITLINYCHLVEEYEKLNNEKEKLEVIGTDKYIKIMWTHKIFNIILRFNFRSKLDIQTLWQVLH